MVNKPRIHKQWHGWECVITAPGKIVYKGFGNNPNAAYNDCIQLMNQRLNNQGF